MSPKLFSIFVEELINEVQRSGTGIRIGKVRFAAIMYADDLLLMATNKEETSIQLKIIEAYGKEHGIKFNPDKTELVVFNRFIKRKPGTVAVDNWNEELMLDGQVVKEVPSFRYLGSYLSYDLNNKTHITKRRSAAFLALKRIEDFGFSSVVTDCALRGNMFKVYIRTVILYGVENLNLSKGEMSNLKHIESSILKKMIKIKQR